MFPQRSLALRARLARQGNQAISRPLAKPSDGLEPSTPSLPWSFGGNRSQPTATVFACLGRFEAVPFATDCHGLRPLGSIKAPRLVASVGYDARKLDISVGWSVR
jgi:hypothetical protein